MPFSAFVAAGTLPCVNILGGDYGTFECTGVRDYTQVMDLAEGHLVVVNLVNVDGRPFDAFNSGTGLGWSPIVEVRLNPSKPQNKDSKPDLRAA